VTDQVNMILEPASVTTGPNLLRLRLYRSPRPSR